MNLPIYNMHMQANSYYQLLQLQTITVAAVLDNVLENPFVSFPWLTAVSAVRNKQMRVIRIHSEVVSCQRYHILVDPNYRHFWKCRTLFVMFLDRVARMCSQKVFNSVKRGARGSEKYMPLENERSVVLVWFSFPSLLFFFTYTFNTCANKYL